jgi:hypothetical protein
MTQDVERIMYLICEYFDETKVREAASQVLGVEEGGTPIMVTQVVANPLDLISQDETIRNLTTLTN